MRVALALLMMAALSGCASGVPSANERGTLLFSMRITQGAFSGVSKADTGFFFYIRDQGLITGYQMKRGDTVDVFGGGSLGSDELRAQLEKIAFEPFDFEREVRRVDEMLAEKAQREGSSVVHMATFDGAEYEIRLVFGSIDYTLKRWNPGPEVDYYAAFSPKIAKLKAVIDLFALHYGRTKFQL